jgi:phage/plasmid-like protein (TIGR03299 family)
MIETMAYNGEVPWHGLGVTIEANMAVKEVLKAAGLNWKVEKKEIFTSDKVKVPDRYAIVRSSDKKPLSISSAKYVPIQNEECMEFFHKFVKAGHMYIETAGSLDGGKRLWILARMKQGDFDVSKNDAVHTYLLLCQSHVPGKVMIIMFTGVRVVCHNTLTMALNQKSRSSAIFTMAHNKKFDDDMKKKAEETLGISIAQAKQYKEAAKILVKKRAAPADVDQYFVDLFQPTFEADDEEYNRVVTKLQLRLENQPGGELAPGSWWNAFNAVTFYADHEAGRTDNNRLRNAWFGHMAKKKQEALHLAVDYANKSRSL